VDLSARRRYSLDTTEKAMDSRLSRRRLEFGLVIAAVALTPIAARAQFVTDVDALVEDTYIFQCCPSNLTVTNNYPTQAIIDDQFTGTTGGIHHANRHDLLFSSDGGSTPRTFDTTDSFDISVDLTLDADAVTPRKEAGIRLNKNGFDGLFVVTSDTSSSAPGEIAAFSGVFPFYHFGDEYDIHYTLGTPITMRIIYTEPGPDPEAEPGTIEYLVDYEGNSYTSGEIVFDNLEKGIVDGSQLGVYQQATAATDTDFAISTFSNFIFGTGSSGTPGDHNGDGIVDAADYALWRSDPSSYDGAQGYTDWVDNFGATTGSGSSLSIGAVP
jgi:hypothetical protein